MLQEKDPKISDGINIILGLMMMIKHEIYLHNQLSICFLYTIKDLTNNINNHFQLIYY